MGIIKLDSFDNLEKAFTPKVNNLQRKMDRGEGIFGVIGKLFSGFKEGMSKFAQDYAVGQKRAELAQQPTQHHIIDGKGIHTGTFTGASENTRNNQAFQQKIQNIQNSNPALEQQAMKNRTARNMQTTLPNNVANAANRGRSTVQVNSPGHTIGGEVAPQASTQLANKPVSPQWDLRDSNHKVAMRQIAQSNMKREANNFSAIDKTPMTPEQFRATRQNFKTSFDDEFMRAINNGRRLNE